MSGIQIEGHSKGLTAGVNDEGRLESDCVTTSFEQHTNIHESKSYYMGFEQSPTANDDCIGFIKNGSADDIIVSAILIQVSAACDVYIKLGDSGTRNAATDVTPVNGNAGSGNTASGDFEKGADLDGGAATMAGGSTVAIFRFVAATNSAVYTPPSSWILPKNTAMSIWCSSSAATVLANVLFFYHD